MTSQKKSEFDLMQNIEKLQFEDPYRKPAKFWRYCDFLPQMTSQMSDEPVVLQSYLNVFKVTQVTSVTASQESVTKNLRFRVKADVVQDEDLALKVKFYRDSFNSSDYRHLTVICFMQISDYTLLLYYVSIHYVTLCYTMLPPFDFWCKIGDFEIARLVC